MAKGSATRASILAEDTDDPGQTWKHPYKTLSIPQDLQDPSAGRRMRWWCGGTSWGKREDSAATAGAGGHVGAASPSDKIDLSEQGGGPRGIVAGRLATRSSQSENKTAIGDAL